VDPLEEAILRTVFYADVFNFPLTPDEIHHYLIAPAAASKRAVEQMLVRSERLQQTLTCIDGYFVRVGREELVDVRRLREAASLKLWDKAVRYGRLLSYLPFVRMVALTGALAVHNAVDGDDIDYILVTREGRVWFARACAIVVVRLAKLRGVLLCPNYVLAESALQQQRRDIFMAHEIAQMTPLYGHSLYAQMRAENDWVKAHLPHADAPRYQEADTAAAGVWLRLKQVLEACFGGALGDTLENWECTRKIKRFAPRLQQKHSGARLDHQHVKGHFNDHGHPALQKYRTSLQEHGLT
jgi:hypothetical protein